MESEGHVVREEESVKSAALLDGLLRVSQIVRFRLNDWLGRFELNDGRHAVLAALDGADEDGCSQADLAEKLCQSESNVSTLIERMQRDGLVSRSRSESDRRKRVLQMTSAGRSAFASVDANRSDWARRLFKGMETDDRLMLLTLLQRLGASLEPSFTIQSTPAGSISASPYSDPTTPIQRNVDPADDPQSPQFALRRMLLALSSSTGNESNEKEVA